MKRLIALTLVALVPSLTAQDPMIKKIVEEGQHHPLIPVEEDMPHDTTLREPQYLESDGRP